ncbi:MAG TPA: ABC transporter ATP-binding protein [Egicoccus sp.]|nr:ABC transporter ATP-binding protein [Egicoccus sp.]HSK23921.1 ABC transporter ATP-binding protein [Egicoccus sp.]
MNDVAIRVDGLVKDYVTGPPWRRRPPVHALQGVDLEVERGEVFGFLGPNGAGKSTTIRVLLDLLRPTAGRVEVLGGQPAAAGPPLRARIGYLPGELNMAGQRTAGEELRYLATLRGGQGADRIAPLAARFDLDLDRPIRGLSKGNKQKVGVIQAFMHRPELLILDEPTSGLDPLLQREFLDLVREAQADGATVFMSSHVLSEVEDVAGRVAIIRAGRIVDTDDVRTLRHHAGQLVHLRFATSVDAGEFRDLPGVEDVVVDGDELSCLLRGEPDALLKTAARHHVRHWSAADRDLEALFLDFYRLPVTEPTTEPEEVAARGR